MAVLNNLSVDYYNNRISLSDYRAERTRLLKLLDEELNGVKDVNIIVVEQQSLIDKTLSFLKFNKYKETN